jgi:hypothetical protein
MGRYPHVIKMLLNATLLLLIFPGVAHAYLDPGTGSLILQVVLAGVLTVLYTIKMYWQQLKFYVSTRLLRRRRTGDG